MKGLQTREDGPGRRSDHAASPPAAHGLRSTAWLDLGLWTLDVGPGCAVGTTTRNYYPFGEEIGSTANDQYKFAATYRDSATGLDYAINRYYASGTARFLTVDPAKRSAKPRRPGTWNRYAYVGNDPINRRDPRSLDGDDEDWPGDDCVDFGECDPPIEGPPDNPEPIPPAPISGGSPFTFADLANAARSEALKALDKEACSQAINPFMSAEALKAKLTGATILGQNLTPTTVWWDPDNPQGLSVGTLVAQTSNGVITANTSGGEFTNPSAVTAYWQGTSTAYGTVNLVQLANSKYGTNVNDAQFRAAFLLHELGHIVNGFSDDTGNFALSSQYTKAVFENCFK